MACTDSLSNFDKLTVLLENYSCVSCNVRLLTGGSYEALTKIRTYGNVHVFANLTLLNHATHVCTSYLLMF